MIAPSACGECGVEQRAHAQRWAWGVGWHSYVPPPQELIKQRMRQRRAESVSPAPGMPGHQTGPERPPTTATRTGAAKPASTARQRNEDT